MAARVELPTKALQGALLATALTIGLLAGVDPKLALVAAVGLIFVVVVLSNLAAGIALLALIAFLEVLPFGGAAVSIAKATGALLALSWLALLATRRETENDFFSSHPGLSYVLLAFLGWAALSSFWAEDSGAALESAYRFGLNLMLLPIVFTAIRSSRHVVWVLSAFLVGAVASASYGMLTPAASESAISGRLAGVGLDPNELAALLVATLTFAAALAARQGTAVLRVAAAAAIPFCLAGVLLSLSRGGLVALSVALLTAVVVGGRWRGRALVLLVVAAIAVVFYIGSVATPAGRAHLTQTGGGTGRTDIWTVGWRMVEAHPFTGVGANNFRVASVHYLLEPGVIRRSDFIVETPKVAHNMYLEVLADLGVVGLTLFLVIIAFSVRCAVGAARAFKRCGDAPMELFARALIVAIAALLAADFFLSEQYSKQLWLLLALGPAMAAVARREARTSPADVA
jgi:O-antigen ligase